MGTFSFTARANRPRGRGAVLSRFPRPALAGRGSLHARPLRKSLCHCFIRILLHFRGSLAEREGFEPPIGLHLCRISSAVHSTTLPPLQGAPSREPKPPWSGPCSKRGRLARQGAEGQIRKIIGPSAEQTPLLDLAMFPAGRTLPASTGIPMAPLTKSPRSSRKSAQVQSEPSPDLQKQSGAAKSLEPPFRLNRSGGSSFVSLREPAFTSLKNAPSRAISKSCHLTQDRFQPKLST
jgi:hypothetical protein